MFNFHPNKSFENYPIGTYWKSDHFVVFESDEERFGGFRRLDNAHGIWFEVQENQSANQRPHSLKLYLPARTCIILCPYENAVKLNVQLEQMPAVTDRQRNQVQSAGPRMIQQSTAPKVHQVPVSAPILPEEKKEHEKQAMNEVDALLAD